MNEASTIGLDLAKQVFQLRGADATGHRLSEAIAPDWFAAILCSPGAM